MKCPYIAYHITSTKIMSSSFVCLVPVLSKLSQMLPLSSCDMITHFQSLDFLTTLSFFQVMRSKLNKSYLKHCFVSILIISLLPQVPSTYKKLLLSVCERCSFFISLSPTFLLSQSCFTATLFQTVSQTWKNNVQITFHHLSFRSIFQEC